MRRHYVDSSDEIITCYDSNSKGYTQSRLKNCEYNELGTQLLVCSAHSVTLWSTDKHGVNFLETLEDCRVPQYRRDYNEWNGASWWGDKKVLTWRNLKEVFLHINSKPLEKRPLYTSIYKSHEISSSHPAFKGEILCCRGASTNENVICISAINNTLLYDVTNEVTVRTFPGGSQNVFSEDGNTMYYSWKIDTIRCISMLDMRAPNSESILITETKTLPRAMATTGLNNIYFSERNKVTGYDCRASSILFEDSTRASDIQHISAQKNGKHIAVGREDSAAILDSITGAPVFVFYDYGVLCPVISPANDQIAILSPNAIHTFNVEFNEANLILTKSARKV